LLDSRHLGVTWLPNPIRLGALGCDIDVRSDSLRSGIAVRSKTFRFDIDAKFFSRESDMAVKLKTFYLA
jgi:hypothetical protein